MLSRLTHHLHHTKSALTLPRLFGKHRLNDFDLVTIFVIVILPNIFYVNDRDSLLLRNLILLSLAAVILWRKPELRQFLIKHIWLTTGLTLAIVVPLTLSIHPLDGLLGYANSPVGSLTGIVAFSIGYLITRNNEVLTQRSIVISAILSLIVASLVHIIAEGFSPGRLVGFYEHSLSLAVALGIGAIFAWHTCLRLSTPTTYLWLLITCSLVAGIALSGSRLALVTLIAALMLQTIQRTVRPDKVTLVLAAATIIASSFLLIPRLRSLSYASESLEFRGLLIERGVTLIAEHPLGVGMGAIGHYTFSTDLPSALLEPYHHGFFIESLHNLWIDVMLGYGVIPGLIFTWLCIKKIWGLLRNHQRNLQAPAVAFIFLLLNFVFTPPALTLLVWLGVLWCLTDSRDKPATASPG